MTIIKFLAFFFALAFVLATFLITIALIWSVITGNIWKIRVPWGFMFFNFFGNSNGDD